MYIVVKSVAVVIGGNVGSTKVNSSIYIGLFVFAIIWPIAVTTFLMW
jgi:hypothetical protein